MLSRCRLNPGIRQLCTGHWGNFHGLRSLRLGFGFSTFIKLAMTLKSIELESSNLHKKNKLKDYLSTIERGELPQIEKLLKFAFNPFASISNKSIEGMLVSEGLLSEETLKKLLEESHGDVAKVVCTVYGRKGAREVLPSADLEIGSVVQKLESLKEMKGQGSRSSKFGAIKLLLDSCTHPFELEYLTKILIRNLNLGMTSKTINPILNELFQKMPMSNEEESILVQYSPMLARPLKSYEQAVQFSVNKGCRIAAEVKYDGQRTNIYYERNKLLRLVSRSGKDQHSSFPDLYPLIKEQLDATADLQNIVMDAEIVAVERDSLKPLPIQTLIGRKGKSRENMSEKSEEKIMVFDVLEKNGKCLIQVPFQDRIAEIPKFTQGIFCEAQRKLFTLPQQQEQFKSYFEQEIKQGYEGLIIKPFNSSYDVKGGRKDWAKLKKGCTIGNRIFQGVELDLVLMGVDKGRGKRSNTFGSFLFGTQHNGKFIPMCKVGTGFSEVDLYQLSVLANKLLVNEKPPNYDVPGALLVDHWCWPEMVCEISSQEFTRSPLYKLGEEKDKGGLSLRFPKFVRRRQDKGVGQATSGQEILQQLN